MYSLLVGLSDLVHQILACLFGSVVESAKVAIEHLILQLLNCFLQLPNAALFFVYKGILLRYFRLRGLQRLLALFQELLDLLHVLASNFRFVEFLIQLLLQVLDPVLV